MAAILAVIASQSYQSSTSIGSVKAARPSWCERHCSTVMSCFPAWANSGQISATRRP